MNCICPNCSLENAYFTSIDVNGTNYECPDCEFEWTDNSLTVDESDEEEE